MVKSLQQTESDVIITVDDKVYTADIATFELEAGGTFPKLPTGAEYRVYEPGIRHALVGGHGRFSESGEMPWTIGDNVLNNIDTFMEAQTRAQTLVKIHEEANLANSTHDMELAWQAEAKDRAEKTKAALEAYYKTKDGLKDYSANKRYMKQVGGTVSGVFGKLTTDDRSVMMLSNIVQSFSLGLVEGKVNFKGVEEWVEIDKDQAIALAKEVVGFVQNCFNTELAIAADIEDGKITSTEQIDQAYA
jgi:hypothetical protein